MKITYKEGRSCGFIVEVGQGVIEVVESTEVGEEADRKRRVVVMRCSSKLIARLPLQDLNGHRFEDLLSRTTVHLVERGASKRSMHIHTNIHIELSWYTKQIFNIPQNRFLI
jgi:hypothetical protein